MLLGVLKEEAFAYLGVPALGDVGTGPEPASEAVPAGAEVLHGLLSGSLRLLAKEGLVLLVGRALEDVVLGHALADDLVGDLLGLVHDVPTAVAAHRLGSGWLAHAFTPPQAFLLRSDISGGPTGSSLSCGCIQPARGLLFGSFRGPWVCSVPFLSVIQRRPSVLCE